MFACVDVLKTLSSPSRSAFNTAIANTTRGFVVAFNLKIDMLCQLSFHGSVPHLIVSRSHRTNGFTLSDFADNMMAVSSDPRRSEFLKSDVWLPDGRLERMLSICFFFRMQPIPCSGKEGALERWRYIPCKSLPAIVV